MCSAFLTYRLIIGEMRLSVLSISIVYLSAVIGTNHNTDVEERNVTILRGLLLPESH